MKKVILLLALSIILIFENCSWNNNVSQRVIIDKTQFQKFSLLMKETAEAKNLLSDQLDEANTRVASLIRMQVLLVPEKLNSKNTYTIKEIQELENLSLTDIMLYVENEQKVYDQIKNFTGPIIMDIETDAEDRLVPYQFAELHIKKSEVHDYNLNM
jgi:hypothetical protein